MPGGMVRAVDDEVRRAVGPGVAVMLGDAPEAAQPADGERAHAVTAEAAQPLRHRQQLAGGSIIGRVGTGCGALPRDLRW